MSDKKTVGKKQCGRMEERETRKKGEFGKIKTKRKKIPKRRMNRRKKEEK
jgi:hypothetical protein